MKIDKGRMEAFSDGVIGIAITLVVFNMPKPTGIDVAGISNILINLAVLFVTFIVVGAEWVKHYTLLTHCEVVSKKVIWRNLIYLFFLALEPFFTSWIMENPGQITPAIAYDIVFFGVLLSFYFLKEAVINESNDEHKQKYKANKKRFFPIVCLYLILTVIVIGISFIYPEVSIVFFILIPVVSSLTNLWGERKEK